MTENILKRKPSRIKPTPVTGLEDPTTEETTPVVARRADSKHYKERRDRRRKREYETTGPLSGFQVPDGYYSYWATVGDPRKPMNIHNLTVNDTYDFATYGDCGITEINGKDVSNEHIEMAIDGQRKQVLLIKPIEFHEEEVQEHARYNDAKLGRAMAAKSDLEDVDQGIIKKAGDLQETYQTSYPTQLSK